MALGTLSLTGDIGHSLGGLRVMLAALSLADAEDQAVGRAHRIGQQLPVQVSLY